MVNDMPRPSIISSTLLCRSVRRTLPLIATFLLFAALFPPSVSSAAAESNILLLHSYHQGYEWSDSVHAGIVDELDASGRDDIALYVEYLDTTRNPGKRHSDTMRELLRQRYTEKGIVFDVVLCTDDNAFRFFLDEGAALFGDVPTVFCGINDFTSEQIAGRSNITGVNESISLRETLEIAMKLRPSAKHVAVVSDSTMTGRRNLELLRSVESRFSGRVEFLHFNELEPEELSDRLKQLTADDIVLYLSYLLTPERRVFSVKESVRFVTAATAAPVFGCWDFLLAHGIVGGKVAHGYSQGQEAAALALKILGGAKADDLPILIESPNRYVFNASQLERFCISESLLPPRSLLVNRKLPPLPEEWKGIAESNFFGYELFMAHSAPMLLVDPVTGIVLDGNPAAHSFYGYGALRGMHLQRIEAAMSPEELRTQLRRAGTMHSNHFSTRNRTADGTLRDVEVYTYPVSIEGRDIFFSMIIDTTDRIRAEEEVHRRNRIIAAGLVVALLLQSGALYLLTRSEKRFRAFFEQHSVGFAILEQRSGRVKVNEHLCELFGYSREELEKLSWRDLVHPDAADEVATYLKNKADEKVDEHSFETKCVRKDGAPVDVSVSTKLLNISGGSISRAFIIRDISERIRSTNLLASKARELERHQEAIITSMAVLAEFRDGGTGEHIERTKSYVRLLLERSEAREHYPVEQFDLIARSAVLHDIGKVGIPDRILLKPGPLTPEEFDTVRTHPIIGTYAIGKAEKTIGEAPFLKYAREIIQFHHEKWDGSGYPYGLKGEDIPYAGRIMAVADVYDALVSERPYKKAFPHGKAMEIIVSESGRHFDPGLVEVLLGCEKEFRAILEGKGGCS